MPYIPTSSRHISFAIDSHHKKRFGNKPKQNYIDNRPLESRSRPYGMKDKTKMLPKGRRILRSVAESGEQITSTPSFDVLPTTALNRAR